MRADRGEADDRAGTPRGRPDRRSGAPTPGRAERGASMKPSTRATARAAAALALLVAAATARADFSASPGASTQVNTYTDAGSLSSFTTYTSQADALAYDRNGNLLAIIGAPGGAGTIVGLPNNVTVDLG